MENNKNILITGAAGFIGSHVARYFANKYSNYNIIIYDKFTYAGNIENIQDILKLNNVKLYIGDISNFSSVVDVFKKYNITDIIHLAAESHVDRSIDNPSDFITTNIIGTFTLLECAREFWNNDFSKHRFHHVSTDEVYGALDLDKSKKFIEGMPYSPHSPYSASKASSDHLVRSYYDTYGMNITISNCSNNYGPNQFPEKFIPHIIDCLENNEKIPIYGNGENIRDWLYVGDHVKAIDLIFHNGKSGETYNVGGDNEKTNLEIVSDICNIWANIKNKKIIFTDVIEYVKDRPGHDLRYAIDCTKIKNELNWDHIVGYDKGLEKTIKWYLENKKWMDNIKNKSYNDWLIKNYKNR